MPVFTGSAKSAQNLLLATVTEDRKMIGRISGWLLLALLLVSGVGVHGQDKKADKKADLLSQGKPVLWEAGNVSERDLLAGPGGDQMKPDVAGFTFIEEDKSGHNKKFRIKDASGCGVDRKIR